MGLFRKKTLLPPIKWDSIPETAVPTLPIGLTNEDIKEIADELDRINLEKALKKCTGLKSIGLDYKRVAARAETETKRDYFEIELETNKRTGCIQYVARTSRDNFTYTIPDTILTKFNIHPKMDFNTLDIDGVRFALYEVYKSRLKCEDLLPTKVSPKPTTNIDPNDVVKVLAEPKNEEAVKCVFGGSFNRYYISDLNGKLYEIPYPTKDGVLDHSNVLYKSATGDTYGKMPADNLAPVKKDAQSNYWGFTYPIPGAATKPNSAGDAFTNPALGIPYPEKSSSAELESAKEVPKDPNRYYHDTKSKLDGRPFMGTTIPSSNPGGGSMGFDPHKPGLTIIDDELVVDLSKLNKGQFSNIVEAEHAKLGKTPAFSQLSAAAYSAYKQVAEPIKNNKLVIEHGEYLKPMSVQSRA